jgi:hypothetical protein
LKNSVNFQKKAWFGRLSQFISHIGGVLTTKACGVTMASYVPVREGIPGILESIILPILQLNVSFYVVYSKRPSLGGIIRYFTLTRDEILNTINRYEQNNCLFNPIYEGS